MRGRTDYVRSSDRVARVLLSVNGVICDTGICTSGILENVRVRLAAMGSEEIPA